MTGKTFHKNDRVQLNEAGRSFSIRRTHGQIGVVTGTKSNGCVWVRWGENKSSSSYHPDYLKAAP
jgi:uncharacterized protein YodC (DUF2158 family)